MKANYFEHYNNVHNRVIEETQISKKIFMIVSIISERKIVRSCVIIK